MQLSLFFLFVSFLSKWGPGAIVIVYHMYTDLQCDVVRCPFHCPSMLRLCPSPPPRDAYTPSPSLQTRLDRLAPIALVLQRQHRQAAPAPDRTTGIV